MKIGSLSLEDLANYALASYSSNKNIKSLETEITQKKHFCERDENSAGLHSFRERDG